jgi:hypothetical protein
MDFVAVVDQVIALLRQRGRVTYRTLQVKDEISDATTLRIEYRCSPYHQHSALYPIIAHLERALAWRQDDTPEDKLRKLEEALRPSPLPLTEVVPLFAALLSMPLLAAASFVYPPARGVSRCGSCTDVT